MISQVASVDLLPYCGESCEIMISWTCSDDKGVDYIPPNFHVEMQSRNGTPRPNTSLSEHVAREIQRDYPAYAAYRLKDQRRRLISCGARSVKRFIFATVGGVKRISVATGKKSVKVGGSLKRSVTNFTKRAYNEWAYPDNLNKNYDSNRRPQLTVSHPLLTTDPLALSPLYSSHAESSRQMRSRSPAINPASSIKELLRAYGVAPGPVKCRIPPPPAHAIFPADYRNVSRVHVRQRPGSSRPFSRASSRPFTQGFLHSHRTHLVPSIRVSRPPTRSDASSDVLGLSPRYEGIGEMPGPSVHRSGSKWSISDGRPTTAGSTVPRIRSRKPVAEVVSCATQTSPQPTVTTFSPDLFSVQPPSNSNLEAETCKDPQQSVGQSFQSCRQKSPGTVEDGINRQKSSAQQCDNAHGEGKTSKPRRRRRRRARKAQNVTAEEESVSTTETDHVEPQTPHRHSQISQISRQSNITDIESVGLAMEEYYRSQGINARISIDSSFINKEGVMPPANVPALQSSPWRHSGLPATQTGRQSSSYRISKDPPRPNSALIESTAEKFRTPIRNHSVSYVGGDPHHLRREAAKHMYNRRQSELVRDCSKLQTTPAEMPAIGGNQHESLSPPSRSISNSRAFIPNSEQNVTEIPIGYTRYTRPLDPRLSHISIDTHHTRNTSQSTNLSLPASTGRRVSDGPLSLTSDRYHWTKGLTTPPSQHPLRHKRKPNGLSIDTTLSRESFRNSCGVQWQSPLLQRNNVPISKVDAGGIPIGNQDLHLAG